MLGPGVLALGDVARKQDRDGVEVGPGEAADPVVRMTVSGVAEHLRAGDHSLLNSSGKVDSETSSTPNARRPLHVKGDRHPSFILVD